MPSKARERWWERLPDQPWKVIQSGTQGSAAGKLELRKDAAAKLIRPKEIHARKEEHMHGVGEITGCPLCGIPRMLRNR